MARHNFKAILILTLMAIIVASCAPAAVSTPAPEVKSEPTAAPTQPEAASPTQESAAPTQAPASAPIEVEFWTLLTGKLAESLDKMVVEYNTSHPEVKIVNINQGGYAEIQQKMLASVVAGNTPTLAMMDFQNVPYYAQAGVLEPIDAYMTDEDKKDFMPGLLVDLKVGDKTYGLPFNRSTQGIFYNKDLFRQAGLDPEKPPATWDEVLEYSAAIKKLGADYYGTYSTGNMAWFFEPFVYQAGGKFVDEECNFTFNDEYGLKAAKYLQDQAFVTKTALIPSVLTGTFDQKEIEFINGKVGMDRNSTAMNSFIGSVVKFDWGFAPLPAGPAGAFSTSGGANLVISAKASPEQKKAAWDFIHWLTNTENSAAFSMATGYLPTRYSVSELPEVKEFYKTHPTWEASVAAMKNVHTTSCGKLNIPNWEKAMSGAMDRILVNGEDAQTVLDETVKELNVVIAEARANGKLIKR